MVFNTTFNNITVISWQSVSLVEETRVPRENHRTSNRKCYVKQKQISIKSYFYNLRYKVCFLQLSSKV